MNSTTAAAAVTHAYDNAYSYDARELKEMYIVFGVYLVFVLVTSFCCSRHFVRDQTIWPAGISQPEPGGAAKQSDMTTQMRNQHMVNNV